MKYKVILAILNSLSVVRSDYQERTFIGHLNRFFNFDHNIFLLSSSADSDRVIDTAVQENHIPQTLYISKDIGNKSTGLDTLKQIAGKNVLLIVVPESVSFETNVHLLTQVKHLQTLKINMKIGLFLSNIPSDNDLKQLFTWCWRQKIINIFVTFYFLSESPHSKRLLNIFTFNPFGTITVKNITGNGSLEKLFMIDKSDYQQHKFRVGRPWPINNSDNDILWNVIFRILNASYTVVQGPDTNLGSTQRTELFQNTTLDMDIVLFLYGDNDIGQVQKPIKMYPVKIEYYLLVVPEALPYSEFAAYLLNATSNIFFGYFLITIVALMILLAFVRYMKYNKLLLFQSIADILNLLLNDNGTIKYQKLLRVEAYLIVPFTFCGLVFVNGILSTLQSFVTRPFTQPQINTIEDIYNSQLPILLPPALARTGLRSLNIQLSRDDWVDRVHIGPTHKHIGSFNRSMSTVLPHGRAKQLLLFQKHMNIKGYHIPTVNIGKYVGSYPVREDFPFIERIDAIIHRMQGSGLHEKWWRENNIRFMKSEIYKYHNKYATESDFDKFPLPFFIIYGWFAGTIVLFIEIIWNYFTLKWIQRRTFKMRISGK